MVREITLYTSTHSDDLDLEFTKPVVWASTQPHESSLYGNFLWKVTVRLNSNRQGKYLLSGEEIPTGWAWGTDGRYVCFNSTSIEDVELVEW